jgi:HTH-type transcriptional regulator/antitoxin HigA
MTQTELARRLGVSLKHLNQVVKGTASISAELALGLEKVLGPTAAFWATREAHYQAAVARGAESERLEKAIPWASQFPIAELADRDYIPAGLTGADLVVAVLRFFALAHPDQWTDPRVAFRKSQKFKSNPFALSAWLRAGEIAAAEINCKPYDHDRFLDALETVRGLTRLEPEDWHPQLQEACAEAGVAVVVVDAFDGARANGATRWLSPTKALIQLSLRHSWEDIFWFTLFHEAGHVALHRKRDVFLEGEGGAGDGDDVVRLEREADRFAARTLIPPQYDRRLRHLTLAEVPAFADRLGIAPAIVVGRLQRSTDVAYGPRGRGSSAQRQCSSSHPWRLCQHDERRTSSRHRRRGGVSRSRASRRGGRGVGHGHDPRGCNSDGARRASGAA